MIGIVIVAHSNLAHEFRVTLEHVLGPQQQIGTVSMATINNQEDKRAEIQNVINAVDQGSGAAIFVDLFGATPSNLCLASKNGANRRLLYGVNMPMLVEFARHRHLDIDTAIQEAIDAGRRYMGER